MDYPAKMHMERGRKVIDVEIPVLPTYGQLGGQDVAQTFIDLYEIDVVFSLWDSFVVHYLGNLSVPAIPYLPVDTTFTPNMYTNMKDTYRIIAYSKFGREELLKWFPPSKISYIPHGIDTDAWKPSSEDERNKVRDELKIPRSAFLLMFMGANVGERKQIPFQFIIFKKFLETHPDAYMYLYTNIRMEYPHGYDLRTFADMVGILDHIRYPSVDPIIEPAEEADMAKLYGASDLYWSMTLGEGFGLGTLEAEACGIPVAITNCSTGPELVSGHGWLIDTSPDFTFVPVWIPTLQSYETGSGRSALACLEDAYRNPEKLKEYGRKSREFALQYSWDKIMPSWFKLLEEVAEEIELLRELRRFTSGPGGR